VLPAEARVALRFWDGSTDYPGRDEPRFVIAVNSPDAPGRMLARPLDLALGEAFVYGDFEVEGSIADLLLALDDAGGGLGALDWARVLVDAARLKRRSRRRAPGLTARLSGGLHSPGRDRAAVQHHYDVSNEFYSLWLDRRKVYSCGYFPTGVESLDDAQVAKLDLVCRKLRLQPGERLLDVGAGWGALVIHAAQNYGVTALGVTLSKNQVEEGRERVRVAGLADRVRIELRDYREVTGEFDKVASVGMAEHVGKAKMERYFKTLHARLRPGGLALNHAISQGTRAGERLSVPLTGEFMRRYVFPDGEILPVADTIMAAEAVGFEVRDVESLREHYGRTLRHWVANLERAWERAVAEVGVERARVWRIYMSASAYQFQAANLSVHQTLLSRPEPGGRSGLPWSRSDLYSPGAAR
jgi:cyclopropane-fatty-acyl-phospholipid synthase